MTNEIKEWFLMPSIKECLAEYEKQELGLISDIAKHGCAGGVPGLTYYSETASFYDEHEDEIWTILSDEADAAGIANGLMLHNICKQPTSMRVLKNDLVWFAVQVAAQHLEDNLEEELLAPVDQQVDPRC
jgi:hypothetical protein